MSVSLVAVSKPVIPQAKTLKELVAYCARVSNPKNQANHETSDRLFDYLKRHAHWSPFEMVSVTMEIKTSRDIARQILRHRSFSFQEFSQRYAEVPDEPVWRDTRLQDTENRQNSIECSDSDLTKEFTWRQFDVWQEAVKNYKLALKAGIAKEQARALLPEGLTPSTLYMAGTLRSWIHYCDLRIGNGTQKEHQEIAKQCQLIIEELLNDGNAD
jgi:thymidylate synthase (FAD)